MTANDPHIKPMKQIFLPLMLCLSLGFAPMAGQAQQAPDGKAEGLGLMERGMQLLFQELLKDMEPALDEMTQALKDLEPMLRDLAGMIGDVRHYQAPEQLPNGDILIRRKPDAPPPILRPEPVPQGEIEL